MNPVLSLAAVHQEFLAATCAIAEFWGFPRAMGAIYGTLYLAPGPVSLDELARQAQVSKGAASTHVRALLRLQMVERRVHLGDRKDYYVAETRLWSVVRNVLGRRRETQFERALAAVRELASRVRSLPAGAEESPLHGLYVARLDALSAFFDALDGLVGAVLMLDELRLGAAQRALVALGAAARRTRGPA